MSKIIQFLKIFLKKNSKINGIYRNKESTRKLGTK